MAADLNDIKSSIIADEYAVFRELYLLMYAPLMRFTSIYTHCPHMAEDVLADVFLKLWERRDQLTHVRNLRVYLYTAAKNTALNYRSRQAQLTDSMDELPDNQSTTANPETALISSEAYKQVQRTINQLPPRCKLIFQLAKEEGMRYKEIASILGISIKTIDNQLAIALSKIGNAILAYEQKISQ